ncbi:MAG TPA: hypothetical protein VHL34_17060 [Rhizomicrobium sp.]|jgi:hypothetical protein|nr:hypothetical protein [Rhizomicrobium sp.]
MRLAIVTASLVLAAAPALAAAPPPKACTAAQNRQLDFWVGKWDVYAKAAPDKLVAHSLIESKWDGCAVRENWMPLTNAGGGSISSYDPITKNWRQFWADAQGGSALFNGGFDGKSMVLTGVWPQPGHPKQMTRMSYTRLADGSVEQLGVTSDDNGKTWQPSFDFIYRKAK